MVNAEEVKKGYSWEVERENDEWVIVGTEILAWKDTDQDDEQ